MRANPDATATDIQNKALELTQGVETKKLKEDDVKEMKTNITSKEFKLSSNVWKLYLQNFYTTEDDQPYNHANYRSEFLETTDGVQRLIVEMEELKEIEEGELLDNKFDFGTGMRDDVFKRPRVNGKPITNEFIDKFIEQLQTYKIALGELEQ